MEHASPKSGFVLFTKLCCVRTRSTRLTHRPPRWRSQAFPTAPRTEDWRPSSLVGGPPSHLVVFPVVCVRRLLSSSFAVIDHLNNKQTLVKGPTGVHLLPPLNDYCRNEASQTEQINISTGQISVWEHIDEKVLTSPQWSVLSDKFFTCLLRIYSGISRYNKIPNNNTNILPNSHSAFSAWLVPNSRYI